jgi:hypothetical protein
MPQTTSSIVEFLRTALHARYDAILNEPLPERWVDLVDHLNDQEREPGKATLEAHRRRGVVKQ